MNIETKTEKKYCVEFSEIEFDLFIKMLNPDNRMEEVYTLDECFFMDSWRDWEQDHEY